jgi:regulation of enolase protein 1 (concanavalin A-like superfamily)
MTGPSISEEFRGSGLDQRLKWSCPPAHWSIDPSRGVLIVRPDTGTDFWQKTHYGFSADNGHFLFAEIEGDVVVSTRVRFRPVHQYDQAGLMIRISPNCWLKTSVEYEPGGPDALGVVVTNAGYSDWSTQAFPAGRDEVWLRIERQGGDCIVQYSEDGSPDNWHQLRVAHLHEMPEHGPVHCGLYACSPKGAGFVAEFHFLRIEGTR